VALLDIGYLLVVVCSFSLSVWYLTYSVIFNPSNIGSILLYMGMNLSWNGSNGPSVTEDRRADRVCVFIFSLHYYL
jgi:hypothetical protein